MVVLGVGEKGHIYTGVDGMGADATRTYTRRQQTTNHSSFFDLLHPEDRAVVMGLYMCLVAQQEQQQQQQRLRQLQEKHPPARQVEEGKGGWEVEVAVEEDEVDLNLWGGVIVCVCVCVHWEVRKRLGGVGGRGSWRMGGGREGSPAADGDHCVRGDRCGRGDCWCRGDCCGGWKGRGRAAAAAVAGGV